MYEEKEEARRQKDFAKSGSQSCRGLRLAAKNQNLWNFNAIFLEKKDYNFSDPSVRNYICSFFKDNSPGLDWFFYIGVYASYLKELVL